MLFDSAAALFVSRLLLVKGRSYVSSFILCLDLAQGKVGRLFVKSSFFYEPCLAPGPGNAVFQWFLRARFCSRASGDVEGDALLGPIRRFRGLV